MARREPIPYSDDVELRPADEADDIRQAITALRKILECTRGPAGNERGDIHVKTHGCATGEFRVLPNLPAELSQGLFAEEQTFSAVLRFSNSALRPQADVVPDGRGMAIKLFEVAGKRLEADDNDAPTQDFILVNHPVFFAASVKDFLRLEQAFAAGKEERLTAARDALTRGDWNPMNWHWREALTALQIAGHLPSHPAALTYYSMTPIRFGRYVAKYRVRPLGELPSSILDLVTRLGTDPDAMRLMLEQTLAEQHLLFEFQVQLRTSAEAMPVEDATVEWPESQSPYRTVALLLLPRQEINTAEQQAICQRLAFNVWHALEDHRPLGGINRLRREVYPVSVAWRRKETA